MTSSESFLIFNDKSIFISKGLTRFLFVYLSHYHLVNFSGLFFLSFWISHSQSYAMKTTYLFTRKSIVCMYVQSRKCYWWNYPRASCISSFMRGLIRFGWEWVENGKSVDSLNLTSVWLAGGHACIRRWGRHIADRCPSVSI